ncbi:MAG: hypothetical protein QM765_44520 [Myxococcales bacterium]
MLTVRGAADLEAGNSIGGKLADIHAVPGAVAVDHVDDAGLVASVRSRHGGIFGLVAVPVLQASRVGHMATSRVGKVVVDDVKPQFAGRRARRPPGLKKGLGFSLVRTGSMGSMKMLQGNGQTGIRSSSSWVPKFQAMPLSA